MHCIGICYRIIHAFLFERTCHYTHAFLIITVVIFKNRAIEGEKGNQHTTTHALYWHSLSNHTRNSLVKCNASTVLVWRPPDRSRSRLAPTRRAPTHTRPRQPEANPSLQNGRTRRRTCPMLRRKGKEGPKHEARPNPCTTNIGIIKCANKRICIHRD